MAQGIDRLLLGGALAMTGLLHRRLDGVDRRIADVERDRPAPAPAEPAQAPRVATRAETTGGMPLPTGYGLQVTGPEGEDIVLPVCLPPGFELASLELVASFMPDAARRAPAPAPAATAAPAAQPEPAARERLGDGLQLVYGDAGYRARFTPPEPGGALVDAAQAAGDRYASAL